MTILFRLVALLLLHHTNAWTGAARASTQPAWVLFAHGEDGSSETPEDRERAAEARALKKFRVNNAQRKIKLLLAHPDASPDVETELKKVVSISPPVADSPNDTIVSQLEDELYKAVKEEDMDTAEKVYDEISQMHIDDCGAVLCVNAEFYRAFSRKDNDQMSSLWLRDPTATCIHPSSLPLIGSHAVLDSWKRMFAAADVSFQSNWMEVDNVRVSVKGSTAIVTCDEHVYCKQFVRGEKRQTELVNQLVATNIFRKISGKWYLSYHHSSWHAESEAAKQALKHPTQRSEKENTDGAGSNQATPPETTLENILGSGSSQPWLGSSENKPVKRVMMGSLNSLLNGELGDILSGDDQEDGFDFGSGGIIRITSEGIEGDSGSNGQSGGEDSVRLIKQSSGAPTDSAKKNTNDTAGDKDAVRQECISALRSLCEQGAISPKQKRALLTNIISCSARGEFSTIEVAYDLLCREGEDADVANEEFADQCRLLASNLEEGLSQ